MAKHIINDLSLKDGFEYHSITGQSLTEFGKVARYRQLNAIAEIILSTPLSDVYEIITDGIEAEEGMEEMSEMTQQFFEDAFSVQPEAFDPDAVSKEAVRYKAYEMVKQAQLGIDAETYYKCVACLVWIWTAKGERTFDEFLDAVSLEQLEDKFTKLVLESRGAVLPADDSSDNPLEANSSQT